MNNPYSSLSSPLGSVEDQPLGFVRAIDAAGKNLQAFKTKLSMIDVPQDLSLVAVSKTVTIEQVSAMALAGQCHFGENYPDEGVAKIARVNELMQKAWRERANLGLNLEALENGPPALTWHLIGPLQSNKTRMVAEHFDWVQSLDRLKIAKRLSDQRPAGMPPLNVCIQVNISGEATKSGLKLDELFSFAAEVQALPHLRLRGLMAIPEPLRPGENDSQVEQAFTALKKAFDNLVRDGYPVDTLSMGMSADYALAIKAGSNMIRIGTALFGARVP